MLRPSFAEKYDERRLKRLLAILFVALALPTGVVVWQAYDQLKWESWYQYRNEAEALTARIDSEIRDQVANAEARAFTDFSFLTATANTQVVERSPLSRLPVVQDLPGVIGYFQVDPDGAFSTPLAPDVPADGFALGMDDTELADRERLATDLRSILADNALVRDRPAAGERARQQALPSIAAPAAAPVEASALLEEIGRNESGPETTADSSLSIAQASFEQQAFDELSLKSASTAFDNVMEDEDDVAGSASSTNAYGKLQDLRLDEALQRRVEDLQRDLAPEEPERKEAASEIMTRASRLETTSVESVSDYREVIAGADSNRTITTFESEIDPFQFSLLDSGHFVLYRNVWREESRFIQGLLIDRARFSQSVIETAFRNSNLAEMSNLVLGYGDDVIDVLEGTTSGRFSGSAANLEGALLYQSSLGAPLDALQLVFAINRLPPGPGGTVLAWATIAICAVFLGGFTAIYRLGVGQIRLARQQQDFVSAVSHELKTPLTSIRMYGEMLKEGWADENKRHQYYEFIHDESERLTRLIANVLQLARITRNEPSMDLRNVEAGALVDLVRSKIASQVERAGFELDLSITDEARPMALRMDEDCFAQIVINLVDNAIKFSRDAATKRIDIICETGSNGVLQFRVRDFGPGIPDDQLKKIFQLFYRSESELTRETVGTGIGLAIVHQLTKAMGGEVDVINREPGAEFLLTFPVLD